MLARPQDTGGLTPAKSENDGSALFDRRPVLWSFSGRKTGTGKADEAAGLTPGNEDNAASAYFYPERPCLPLLTDGVICK